MRNTARRVAAALALLLGAVTAQAAVNVWQRTLPGTTVFSVATAPGSALYVGVHTGSPYGQGVLKSTDDGQTWTNVFPSATYVYGLAADYSTLGRVYAATGTGLYRTNDGGSTWTLLKSDTRSSITVSMVDPNILYADNWKSTDAGATWTAMPTLPAFYTNDAHLRISAANSSILYAVTSSGSFYSMDAGGNWISRGYGAATLEPDPVDAAYLYQGGWLGTNNVRYFPGGSAKYLTTFPMKALAVDPQSPNLVYGNSIYGTFKSSDHGATWSSYRLGTGPSNVPAGSTVFDNATGKLYAPTGSLVATTNRGLWKVETRGVQTCTDGDIDGFYLEGPICSTSLDCNDAVAAINPAAAENCVDGVDNNCNGLTDCSDYICSGAPSCQSACSAPGNPTNATATAGRRSVTLNWLASSGLTTGYRVYRSLDGISYTFRASVAPTALTYKDTGLTSKKKYYYYIKGWNDCDADGVVDAGEESGASTIVSATAQ